MNEADLSHNTTNQGCTADDAISICSSNHEQSSSSTSNYKHNNCSVATAIIVTTTTHNDDDLLSIYSSSSESDAILLVDGDDDDNTSNTMEADAMTSSMTPKLAERRTCTAPMQPLPDLHRPRRNEPDIMSCKQFVKYWAEMEHSKHVEPPSDVVSTLYDTWKRNHHQSARSASSLRTLILQDVVDQSSLVTKANHTLQNTKQDKAQHGTLMPEGVHLVIQKLNIMKDDIVLDVGSGTGKVLCQLACTTACRAVVGIDIDGSRCDISCFYKGWFERYLQDRLLKSKGTIARVLDQTVRFMCTCN